ncbi:MAG: cell division protein FtsZ [Pseudomonadota bacterium]
MINIRIQTPEVQKLSPKITVVGVGGAGGNAVNNMISSGLEGCEFLVCNTDAQALEGSLCENTMQLGAHVTGGLGAGAKPEIGEKAAHETLDEVMQHLDGANMAFVTAGMGGGTGTGAAPVIAKACRDSGILTVGVVTKPFHFEGTHRMKQAEAGIEEMQDYVDTLIVIPNQNLFRIANEKTTFAEAFKMADSVLQSGVRGVTDLMVMPGLINLDFADIRSAMLEMGKAMMGTGEGDGERRATDAAEAAINNPLLDDVSMKGARGVIINVTGGHDMTLYEVDEACNRIRDEVDPNANIIFGSTFDEKLEGVMRVSVVATGIDSVEASKTIGGGGSNIRVTTLNKATEKSTDEKKLSPNVPQTEVARAMTMQARQESYQPKTVPVKQEIVQSEDPEQDMFEQREFKSQKEAVTTKTNDSLKATIHNGSFIPPTPIMPEVKSEHNYALPSQYQTPSVQPSPELSATKHEQVVSTHETQPASGHEKSSLVLRPPVPGAVSHNERKRTPSLLERITGIHKPMSKRQPAKYSYADQARDNSHSPVHNTVMSEQGASQGQLNIDAPAAQKPDNQDDLDIPAFLRRQAN